MAAIAWALFPNREGTTAFLFQITNSKDRMA